MKLVLLTILTCYFLVETSGAPNYLDILVEMLLNKCPRLYKDKGEAEYDELKKCLMTFDFDNLKKMIKAANEDSARVYG